MIDPTEGGTDGEDGAVGVERKSGCPSHESWSRTTTSLAAPPKDPHPRRAIVNIGPVAASSISRPRTGGFFLPHRRDCPIYGSCCPRSTSRSVEIEQCQQRDAQTLGKPRQLQVRRIPAANLQAAHVGAVEPTFRCQVLLGPALARPKLPNALAEPAEGRMRM